MDQKIINLYDEYTHKPLTRKEFLTRLARIQLHYAELDERVNAGMAVYETAPKDAGLRYEQHLYPGENHAFHNDTSPARYNEAAAKLAWERTLVFFKQHLK